MPYTTILYDISLEKGLLFVYIYYINYFDVIVAIGENRAANGSGSPDFNW